MGMLTSLVSALPYPDNNEHLKDVPDFFLALTTSLDAKLPAVFNDTTDRTTKWPSPTAGRICWMKDGTPRLTVFDGTTWKAVYVGNPRVLSGTAAPTGSAIAGDLYVQY
jgi:hypothetical protein